MNKIEEAMIFEWSDPPDTSGPGLTGKWAQHLAPLRKKPNKWAKIVGPLERTNLSSIATSINKGFYVDIKPGEFQAVTRQVDKKNDKIAVWARYVGNNRDRNEEI